MKRITNRRGSMFILVVFLIAGSLGIAATADAAGWCRVHGASAVVERPDTADGAVTYGWGLDMVPGASGNWVHFPIPSPNGSTTINSIFFRVYLGSSDLNITTVDVYNGVSKVWTTSVTQDVSGYQTIMLPMGSIKSVANGLNICIRVTRGVESMDHRVIFYGAGAYFTN